MSAVSDRAGLFETEHEDFRASFRTFLERDVVPHDAAWKRAGAVPGEVFSVATEHGFVAIAVPERHGGLGVEDFRFNVVIGQKTARAGVAGFGAGLTLHNDVCVRCSCGPPPKRRRLAGCRGSPPESPCVRWPSPSRTSAPISVR